jgi:hypothetical protein
LDYSRPPCKGLERDGIAWSLRTRYPVPTATVNQHRSGTPLLIRFNSLTYRRKFRLGWGPDRRRSGPHRLVDFPVCKMLARFRSGSHLGAVSHSEGPLFISVPMPASATRASKLQAQRGCREMADPRHSAISSEVTWQGYFAPIGMDPRRSGYVNWGEGLPLTERGYGLVGHSPNTQSAQWG